MESNSLIGLIINGLQPSDYNLLLVIPLLAVTRLLKRCVAL